MQCLIRAVCLSLALAVPGLALAAELTVSAAASLTNAFREIGTLFEASNPGIRVRFNFAASGVLLQQIANGAPVDVFASADQETMDQAEARNLLHAGRRDFAGNALVVITPMRSAHQASQLQDLKRPEFARIAIGQPGSVPVGRYARGVLEAAGLWASLEPRLVNATNVRQALDYVQRAEVDAGFVYATDAAILPDKVRVAFTVPTGKPIRYPVAAIKTSTKPVQAQAFVDFLFSPAAQQVLVRHGFSRP